MMTEETVRTAAMSADPGGELDRLVRAELATGRTTTAVYEELLPIVRSVRLSTKLSEDADECLLGTLDALVGHCDPDYWYQNLSPATLHLVPSVVQPTTVTPLDHPVS